MFDNIILATDGSENAMRAAEMAIRLSKELKNEPVTIAHIIKSGPQRPEIIKAKFDLQRLLEEEARLTLEDTIALFEKQETPYTVRVALGDPASEITKLAGTADLLVIGSRGMGSLRGVIMGSVSRKVADHATCPVLIVK